MIPVLLSVASRIENGTAYVTVTDERGTVLARSETRLEQR